jgi:hypothetical protein
LASFVRFKKGPSCGHGQSTQAVTKCQRMIN